jgi:GT2 family glycosyltransferase
MIDPRLRFIVSSDDRQAAGGDGATVFISAGSRLDPEALGWISYGLSQLEEGGLGCDWDWCTHRWDGPVVYTDPQLNGLFDLDRLLSLETPPPLVAFRGQVPGGPLDGEGRRHALAQRSVHAPIVHVPLPLVAIGGIAERAKIAPENGEPMPLWSQPRRAPRRPQTLPLEIVERDGRPALTCGPLKDVSERIRIIIPTRDCVADLAVAIESLIDTAHHPETLTFCLIDNRSVEPETIIYLQGAAARDRFEVLQYDAPFNWSAINNYGAELGDEPILLFANNDIRMLSSGWDDRLRAQLQRRDVGAVGARLLYPDGSIQHAGIVFDIFEGAPQHDGVGLSLANPETDPRFDHPQAFGAVTGAFLGLRRTVFQDAGRLDSERFIIAYNDIDLCLSLRSLGLCVLYDAGIEAIHYESRTRGFNDNRRRVAWDQEELRALHQKWGAGMSDERGLSPWWHRDERYCALRPQTSDEIARHLRLALSHGWRPRQA